MRSEQFVALFIFLAVAQISNAEVLTRENARALKMPSHVLFTFPEDAEDSRSLGRYTINGKEIECSAMPPRYSKIVGDLLEFPEPQILLLNHYPYKKAVFSVSMSSDTRNYAKNEIVNTTLNCEYLTQSTKAGNLTIEDMQAYFKKSETQRAEQVGQMGELLNRISALNSHAIEPTAQTNKTPKSLTSNEDSGTYSASGHSLNRISDKITGKNLNYSTSDILQRNILIEAIGTKNNQ